VETTINAILDADSFVFRAAATADSKGEDLFQAAARVDYMINTALNETEAKEYILFLTGKDNFRCQVFPEYKAFRKDKPRPKWEQALKNHLKDQWDAQIVNGMEADDACGIAQYGSPKDKTILIHHDKDLNQLAGWHYNFVKKEKYYVDEEMGITWFLTQLLMGDRTDGIPGIDGIGPVKAAKLLSGKTRQEQVEAILNLYGSEEEMEMNAKCVFIWRKENDYWKDHVLS